MKKVVTFGEIMLRLASPGYLRFSQSSQLEATFGGGEANVAVSLANYGIPASFVSRLPKNDIGEWAIQNLRKYNVQTQDILRGGERVGIYFLETGAVARASKVVYDRAGSAIADIQPGMLDWEAIFKDANWFHWTGITPALSEGAAATCLEGIKMANKLGVTVSTDLNFRKNLWKYGKTAAEVMPELVAGCDVILGNEEDAEKVFHIQPEGVDVTAGHVEACCGSHGCQRHSNQGADFRYLSVDVCTCWSAFNFEYRRRDSRWAVCDFARFNYLLIDHGGWWCRNFEWTNHWWFGLCLA